MFERFRSIHESPIDESRIALFPHTHLFKPVPLGSASAADFPIHHQWASPQFYRVTGSHHHPVPPHTPGARADTSVTTVLRAGTTDGAARAKRSPECRPVRAPLGISFAVCQAICQPRRLRHRRVTTVTEPLRRHGGGGSTEPVRQRAGRPQRADRPPTPAQLRWGARGVNCDGSHPPI